MRLNGDYFDDLKLTDADIESSDDVVNLNTDDYANEKEYYNDMSSKYSHYIVINIDADHIITDSELWTDKVPHMLKKLFYLFDSYGIEYSKPVVSQSDYFVEKFIKNKFKGCKFFDFHGYKLITYYDIIKDIEENRDALSVLLFFNLPKLHSYTTACKFVGNMMRTLWRNEDHNTIVLSIDIHNIVYIFIPDKTFTIGNPYRCGFLNIDKTSIGPNPDQKVVNIINLFFPEKERDDIIKELIKDKQLLLKLYKCYPDY